MFQKNSKNEEVCWISDHFDSSERNAKSAGKCLVSFDSLMTREVWLSKAGKSKEFCGKLKEISRVKLNLINFLK